MAAWPYPFTAPAESPLVIYRDMQAMNKDASIKLKINDIVNDIKERKRLPVHHGGLQKRISNAVSALWENKKTVNKRDKNFMVNDLCNGCGTCRHVSPTGNSAGTGKLEYQHHGEFCLACIHLCPQNAIHVKNEKSEKHFRNHNVKLLEIIHTHRQN